MAKPYVTWEQWLQDLDAVAAEDNCERGSRWTPETEARWRAKYEAGLTPRQAWNATPWDRKGLL